MTITINIGLAPNVIAVLNAILNSDSKTATLLAELKAQGASMTTQLQTLTDQVTANNTLIGSAVTLIGGLAAQIQANVNDPVALQALADSLKQNDDTLAAAVVANTPAPTPPPAPAQS
jgi:hypothetical protein